MIQTMAVHWGRAVRLVWPFHVSVVRGCSDTKTTDACAGAGVGSRQRSGGAFQGGLHARTGIGHEIRSSCRGTRLWRGTDSSTKHDSRASLAMSSSGEANGSAGAGRERANTSKAQTILRQREKIDGSIPGRRPWSGIQSGPRTTRL